MSDEFKAFLQGGLPMLVAGALVFWAVYEFANALCDRLGLQ